ncbi:unnamed protein product [Aphanomyces euteiches]
MQSKINNKPKTTTLLGIQIDRKEPAVRGNVHRTTSVRKTRSSPEFNDILPKTIVDFTEDSNEKKRENLSLQAIHREFGLASASTTTESTSGTASNQDESDDIPRPHKTVESFPSNTDDFESLDTRQTPPSRNAIRSFKPILKARLAKVATIRGLGESKKADCARHITWQEENTDANFSSDEPATSSEASDTSSERQSSDDVEDIFSGITLNFMDELKHEVQDSQIFLDLHREFDMAPANTSTIEYVLNSAKVDLANKYAGIQPKVTPRRMTLQDAIKAGHVQTKQKIDQVQNAKPVRSTNIRTVERQTKLVQERKAIPKTKLDQKCISLATSKTKLPPLVVAKNEEIAQLKAQLAEFKAEAEYNLVVHAQTEKHLRELNDERLQEIDALTQLLSQERAEIEHQREENCHLTQCVEELKEQNHNQKNYQIKYETIVVEFEEARRHWSATQTTSEERLGYYKRQLATAQRRLGSAIHDKLESEVQIRCLQNILHQTVQDKNDSPVCTVTNPTEDHTRELNEYSQISDRCLASEECNLEMTVENHKAEKIRDCQIINQLHVTVHETNEYKQLVATHEDTVSKWNASQMAFEDQLSRAHEQLELINKQLVDALVAKHQYAYEIESLQSILRRCIQEREVSNVNKLVFPSNMNANKQNDHRAQLLVAQSKSKLANVEQQQSEIQYEYQENSQLARQLAAVQSELSKTKHDLRIHEQSECDLWGEMHDYYQIHHTRHSIFNCLANENRNLQTTVETLTAQITRDSQIVHGLDFGVQSGSQTQIKAMQEMIDQILEENEVLHNENKTSDTLQQALQAKLREVNSRNDFLRTQCDDHESKIKDLESKLHEA